MRHVQHTTICSSTIHLPYLECLKQTTLPTVAFAIVCYIGWLPTPRKPIRTRAHKAIWSIRQACSDRNFVALCKFILIGIFCSGLHRRTSQTSRVTLASQPRGCQDGHQLQQRGLQHDKGDNKMHLQQCGARRIAPLGRWLPGSHMHGLRPLTQQQCLPVRQQYRCNSKEEIVI